MTERQYSIFMYMNLFNQSEAWLWGIDGLQNNMKRKCNLARAANKNFIIEIENEIEKQGGPGYLEQFLQDGEHFSKALEVIKKAPTTKKKQELYEVMVAWLNGNVQIKEDE